MALAFDRGFAHRLLIVPALFEEANRLRRFTVEVMRLLADTGIDCFLPDLPGCNESTAPLELQAPGDWLLAMTGAALYFDCTHVLAMRGGALVAPRDLPGWHYAPVNGASQLRQLLRARLLASREAGKEETPDALMERGREYGLELAGYYIGADFICEIQGLVPETSEDICKVGQDMLNGPALWLRAEPGEDRDQSATLAAIISVGMAVSETGV